MICIGSTKGLRADLRLKKCSLFKKKKCLSGIEQHLKPSGIFSLSDSNQQIPIRQLSRWHEKRRGFTFEYLLSQLFINDRQTRHVRRALAAIVDTEKLQSPDKQHLISTFALVYLNSSEFRAVAATVYLTEFCVVERLTGASPGMLAKELQEVSSFMLVWGQFSYLGVAE